MEINKNWIYAILLLCIGICGFTAYNVFQIKSSQKEIETSVLNQKKITDDILRSSSNYATQKDIENYAKENKINLDAIKKDLNKLDANITSINTVSYNSSGYVIQNVESNSVIKNPDVTNTIQCIDKSCFDKYNYIGTIQKLNLNEKFGSTEIPFGNVSFAAGNKEPWSLQAYSREYKLYTTIGEDENGRQYAYNKATISSNGQLYNLPITQANILQVYPSPSFHFWNPRFYLGINGSLVSKMDILPSASFGFITYGKSKTNPTFSFLQLGVGYGIGTKKPVILLTPVSYRLGEQIGILKNTYVNGSIGLSFDKNYYLQLGISTSL